MSSISAAKALKRALGEHLPWNGARLTFLAQFLLALFQVKTVNLAQLATALSGRAKVASNYRRLQRFFQSFYVDPATIAQLIVHLLPLPKGPWFLTLDRTSWRFGKVEFNILMLGIAHQGSAFPILWTLLDKAGDADPSERIALLERFIDWFGKDKIAALLAEWEFVGETWFDYLTERGIPFRIRIKADTLIPNLNGVPKPIHSLLGDLSPNQVRVLAGQRRIGNSLLSVVGMKLASEEHLIVLTDQAPETAITDYAHRWEVETLFDCLQSRGFRFENTHLTDPERISKLISLLAIAFAWAYHTGEWLHEQPSIPFTRSSSLPSLTNDVQKGS